MPGLLLELFSEEVPALMQSKASVQLKELFIKNCKQYKLLCDNLEVFFTPRRLVLLSKSLTLLEKSVIIEKKGPRVGSDEKAIAGFSRSVSAKKEDLEIKTTPKGEFYFYNEEVSYNLNSLLLEVLNSVLSSLSWPKTMRWGDKEMHWVRPLHNILCVYNGAVLPLKFGHLEANNITYGHRFLSKGKIEVENIADYKEKLRAAYVILDQKERRSIIEEKSLELASSLGFKAELEESLIEEITGLVEWPVVLACKFDDKFLSLPKEVILFTIRHNQKYINLFDEHDNLVSHFLVVSNMVTEDEGSVIISGNEKVVRARLEDAGFFLNLDLKSNHQKRLEKLENLVLHEKLGSLADKVNRIVILSKFISVWIPHANLLSVERAAMICKDDLVTEMISEFPDLQGVMGYYYAMAGGETKEVAQAVYNHYKPVGVDDESPSDPLSIVLSLSDKIDSLVGMFLINVKPTSSKDPYALRRSALGVVRIILENSIRIPLKLVLEKALNNYNKSTISLDEELLKIGKKRFLNIKRTSFKVYKKNTLSELMEFFNDRLSSLLKDAGINPSLSNAFFPEIIKDDLTCNVINIKFLKNFLTLEDGIKFYNIYKRVNNILSSEINENNRKHYSEPVNKDLFVFEEEKKLCKEEENLLPSLSKLLKKEDLESSVNEMLKLLSPLELFLDNVKVNDENKEIKENRIKLLYKSLNFIKNIVDFSKIDASLLET